MQFFVLAATVAAASAAALNEQFDGKLTEQRMCPHKNYTYADATHV